MHNLFDLDDSQTLAKSLLTEFNPPNPFTELLLSQEAAYKKVLASANDGIREAALYCEEINNGAGLIKKLQSAVNDPLVDLISKQAREYTQLTASVETSLKDAQKLIEGPIRFKDEADLSHMFAQYRDNSFSDLLSEALIDHNQLAIETLSSSFGSELAHAKLLADEMMENLASATSLFSNLQIPKVSLLGELSREVLSQTLGEFDEWHRASSLMADAAQLLGEIPFDVREQWINDIEEIEDEVQGEPEPISPQDVSENLEKEIQVIKKGKMPRWLLRYLKNPDSYVNVAGLILMLMPSKTQVSIDNSVTTYNFSPIINFNLSFNTPGVPTTITNGEIRTSEEDGQVYLRSGPGKKYVEGAILIDNKTFVSMLGREGQWAKVSLIHENQSKEGWIALKFIHFFEPTFN